MAKKLKKNKGGAPSKYDETIVKELERALRVGATVDQACSQAKITRQTYYNWLESNNSFLTRMQYAQNWLNFRAKEVVSDKITKRKDDYNARWWLEKTEFKNQGPQTNIQVNMGVDFIENDGDTSQTT